MDVMAEVLHLGKLLAPVSKEHQAEHPEGVEGGHPRGQRTDGEEGVLPRAPGGPKHRVLAPEAAERRYP
jgi:hypothetical protein